MGARRGHALAALALCVCTASSTAQEPQLILTAPNPVRDVLFEPDSALVYLASYDTDEVLCLDPRSREIVTRIATGDGPAALAASGAWVAVLNRHDSSLTLIDASTRSVHGAVELDSGATVVFDAGDARFGIVNPFDQSISLVDAQSAVVSKRAMISDGVPVTAARAGDRIAVLVHAPEQVRLLDPASLESARTIPIASGVVQLKVVSPAVVALASTDRILMLDTGSARIVNELTMESVSIDRVSSGLIGVSGSMATELAWDGSRLTPTSTWPIPERASRALDLHGGFVAWAPGSNLLWQLGPSGSLALAAQDQPDATGDPGTNVRPDLTQPVTPPPPAVVAQAQRAQDEPLQPEQLEPPIGTAAPDVPATEDSPPSNETVPAPVDGAVAPDAAATEDSPQSNDTALAPADGAVVPDVTAAEDSPPSNGIASVPIEDAVAPETRDSSSAIDTAPAADAVTPDPRFSKRPSRSNIRGKSPYPPYFGDPEGSFERELTEALKIGKDSSSLLSVDWSQSPEDVVSDLGSLRLVDGRIEADQPTSFRMGDTLVRANAMSISTVDSEVELRGEVRLERPGAFLTADTLRIVDPPVALGGLLTPLLPLSNSRGVPHPLLPHGKTSDDFAPGETAGTLIAQNVVWEEEGKREIIADHLELDLRTRAGTLTNTEGRAGPLFFGSETLHIEGAGNLVARDLWVTTCDRPEPHYRLRLSNAEVDNGERVTARNVRLQVGKVNTPFYLPWAAMSLQPDSRVLATELELGTRADLGTFLNVAQWFKATDHANLAPRIYATTQQGIGVGVDGEYNLMDSPAATFYRSDGEFQTLYTTEDRGYLQWYHRQELTLNSDALVQWEQWSDSDFVKDFYPSEYSDRTGPRSFINLTRTRPEYITTATFAPSTHSFTRETEKLPELTFHLLERSAAGGLYGTFDTVAGYYRTQPDEIESARTLAIGRLSYDWNVAPGFNILPFVEVDGTYYSRDLDEDNDALRGSATVGVTLQGRLQRGFRGVANFSGFKHIIIPSTTLLYRPAATVDASEIPRFDDLDDRPSRFRLENTIDNIILGRNAATNTIWPVARMTVYTGNDFYNETAESADYALEVEIRPRPWWGIHSIGEVHDVQGVGDADGDDFNRVLAYFFYDNELDKNNLNARIGFAHTQAAGDILNQEVLYGAGYKLSENWSVGFEQRFDINENRITRQSYGIRRRLHKWELELFVRDRDRGLDVGFQVNLTDFRDIGIGL